MFSPSLSTYKKRLRALAKYRAALGLPESFSLQLLLDEVRVLEGEK